MADLQTPRIDQKAGPDHEKSIRQAPNNGLPNRQPYTELKLEACASAAVADHGPPKGHLTFESGDERFPTTFVNKQPYSQFTADNGYAGVSVEIWPGSNNAPTSLTVDAHSGDNNTSFIEVPDVNKMGSARTFDEGPVNNPAKRMATAVMNNVKSCMASSTIPAAGGSNKTFQVKPVTVKPRGP